MGRAFYYHFPNWIGASVFLPPSAPAGIRWSGHTKPVWFAPGGPDKPASLASLHKLPQLHTALTESRR
jgi:hypothetical protein